jgi:hypothetical protein
MVWRPQETKSNILKVEILSRKTRIQALTVEKQAKPTKVENPMKSEATN